MIDANEIARQLSAAERERRHRAEPVPLTPGLAVSAETAGLGAIEVHVR